jgi:predicted dehydrogenase
VGEKGTACWDGGAGLAAEVVAAQSGFNSERRPEPVAPYNGPKTGGHAGLVKDFVDCLRTGRTPETICTDNIKSLAMVFGAIASAEGNCSVPVG